MHADSVHSVEVWQLNPIKDFVKWYSQITCFTVGTNRKKGAISLVKLLKKAFNVDFLFNRADRCGASNSPVTMAQTDLQTHTRMNKRVKNI